MKAGLSESARTRTIGAIRQAVAMPQSAAAARESYLVTGEPVIVSDLNHSITRSIELLLIAVLLVMAGTLGLVFSGRPRLLPLAVALLAAALTFGALSLAGASLTMASIAVLPVLVGLAVDYAIQSGQGRGGLGERRSTARRQLARADSPRGNRRADEATAGAASASAMLVLLLSPVPMVRNFGVLLVVGVVIAFACALTAGAAVMVLGQARADSSPEAAATGAHSLLGARLAAAWRGARELVLENPLVRLLSRAALVGAVRRPGRVIGIGLVLAALGWGLDTQTRVETDITKLVPQNLSSLQNLNTLERATGVGGEIDVMVSGKRPLAFWRLTEWMVSAYESAVLKRFGYTATRGCGVARLCPAFSLPDLFGGQAATITPTPQSGNRGRSRRSASGVRSA